MRVGPGYRDSVGFILDPMLVSALIVQLIAFRDRRVMAWLGCAPVRFLGTISYSLYLLQQVALPAAYKMLAAFPAPVRLAAAITVLIGLASASYYLIEQSFLRLKSRFEVRT
jgi:peptidoglycan/LPS O-acetylase OafA/YrhL